MEQGLPIPEFLQRACACMANFCPRSIFSLSLRRPREITSVLPRKERMAIMDFLCCISSDSVGARERARAS